MSCIDNNTNKEDHGDLCAKYKNQSSQDVCAMIKYRTLDLMKKPTLMANVDKIINSSSSKAEKVSAMKEINALLYLKIPDETIDDSTTDCDVKGSVIQFNIIKDTSQECTDIILKYMENVPPSRDKQELIDYLQDSGITYEDVVQTNTAEINIQCAENKMKELLKGVKPTIDSIALKNIIKQKQGIEIPDCSKQMTQKSSCDYFKSLQCCENRLSINQLNIIDPKCSLNGTVKNVTQKNDALVYLRCLSGNDSTQLPEKKGATFNTIEDAPPTSEGFKRYRKKVEGGLIGGWVLFVCLLIVGVWLKNSIVVYGSLIVVLLIMLTVLILKYVQKAPKIIKGSDYTDCNDVVVEDTQDNLSYDDAVDIMMKKEYQGFTIEDTDKTGTVSFFNSFSSESMCNKDQETAVSSVLSPVLVLPPHYVVHIVISALMVVGCILYLYNYSA